MTTAAHKPARSERGFALMLVFVFAAAIAITLYMELPRVAFEAQRDREQLLVDRGEQYKRAIQVYFRKFNRFPGRLEDLESQNGMRFLRKRYKDPMTGKDDWRFIHAGMGGMLVDSKVQSPQGALGADKDKDKKDQKVDASTTGGGDPNQQLPIGLQQRPSDRVIGAPGANPQYNPNDPNAVAMQPGQPGYPQAPPQPGQPQAGMTPGYPQAPGQPPGAPGIQQAADPNAPAGAQPGIQPGIQPGFQPGIQPGLQPGIQPGQPLPAGQNTGAQNPQLPFPVQGQPYNPMNPGQVRPVIPGLPGATVQPVQSPTPFTGYPTQPSTSAVGMTPQPVPFGGGAPNAPQGAAGSNAGIDAIRNLLTRPSQPPPGVTSAFNNTGIQGGIAGVASKSDQEGIKRFDDHSKYSEWEFVYDLKKDKRFGGAVPGMQPGQKPQTGSSSTSTGTSTGTSAGSSSSSSFGSSSFGSGSSGSDRDKGHR